MPSGVLVESDCCSHARNEARVGKAIFGLTGLLLALIPFRCSGGSKVVIQEGDDRDGEEEAEAGSAGRAEEEERARDIHWRFLLPTQK